VAARWGSAALINHDCSLSIVGCATKRSTICGISTKVGRERCARATIDTWATTDFSRPFEDEMDHFLCFLDGILSRDIDD
jgi:hypothetical protein